jgi:hypothetical protein
MKEEEEEKKKRRKEEAAAVVVVVVVVAVHDTEKKVLISITLHLVVGVHRNWEFLDKLLRSCGTVSLLCTVQSSLF